MARNSGLTFRKSGAPRPDVYRAPHSPQRDLHRRLRVARSGPSRHIRGTNLPRAMRTGLGRPRRAQRQPAQAAAPPVHLLRLHPVRPLRLLDGRRVPAGPARTRPVRLLPLHRPSRSLSGDVGPALGPASRLVLLPAPPTGLLPPDESTTNIGLFKAGTDSVLEHVDPPFLTLVEPDESFSA